MIADVQPMQVLVDRAAAPTRFALVLVAAFAVIAVVLATVGLYGVLSTSVRQRTSELGVRLAFGATRGNIATLVLRQGLQVSAIGVALGWGGAFALTPFMASMLIGVAPTDAVTFVSIAVGFLAVSIVASYLPARRAANLDPTTALRE